MVDIQPKTSRTVKKQLQPASGDFDRVLNFCNHIVYLNPTFEKIKESEYIMLKQSTHFKKEPKNETRI